MRRGLVERFSGGESESDMEVALVALGGEPLIVRKSRAEALDVRPSLILGSGSGLKPEQIEASPEGVGELDRNATFTCGVVTNATKRRMCGSGDPEDGGSGL